MVGSITGALILLVLFNAGADSEAAFKSNLMVTIGCLYKNNGSFHLRCSDNRHIDIHNATLGRSGHNTCWRECCQSSKDCTVDTSTLQLQHLKDTCDGRQVCHIQVQRRRCGLYDTDYESVTFRCKTLVAFGCRYINNREFDLYCPENKTITVTGATFGRSLQACWQDCCESNDDHLTTATRSHMQYLTDSCNGHRECRVKVAAENFNQTHDYESVSYTCTDTPANPPERSTEDITARTTGNNRGITSKPNLHVTYILIIGACAAVIIAVISVIVFQRCRHQPSVTAVTNISPHDIPTTTVSVSPSSDTNMSPSNAEAVSSVLLDDLYCEPNECLEQQNNDIDEADYYTILGPTMAQENDTYTKIFQTAPGNTDARSKVESALYIDMSMGQTKDGAESSQ